MWNMGYAAYKEALNNGTIAVLVDGKADAPGRNALPSHPRDQKSTKADPARQA
jgi:hypothetical protein